jgi:hypothetical protein
MIRSSNCNNSEELMLAIRNTRLSITPEDCEAYFNHMKTFLRTAIERTKF